MKTNVIEYVFVPEQYREQGVMEGLIIEALERGASVVRCPYTETRLLEWLRRFGFKATCFTRNFDFFLWKGVDNVIKTSSQSDCQPITMEAMYEATNLTQR